MISIQISIKRKILYIETNLSVPACAHTHIQAPARTRNFFRFDLKETRQGFCWRGRGRSFYTEGPKTEKAREPTVQSLVRGFWKLRVSEAERRVQEGV